MTSATNDHLGAGSLALYRPPDPALSAACASVSAGGERAVPGFPSHLSRNAADGDARWLASSLDRESHIGRIALNRIRRATVDGGYQQQLLLVLKDRRRRLRLVPTGTAQPD
jgi:hypothetical protein